MTIMQLKYAITVANSKSMNEAARTLFISQPSLSASMRELEEEIGVELFRRNNRGISLTPDVKNFRSEIGVLYMNEFNHNSFYFAEEVLSNYEYKRLIKANDRATLLNLMVGLNGYTLCSGILCEELNGTDYCAVKLKSDEEMSIGTENIDDIIEDLEEAFKVIA